MNGEEGQEIDLMKLSLPQLQQLKQQFEGDLNMYQESLQTLKVAQTKFQQSAEACSNISKDAENQEMLVPLTGSMYVPGRLINAEKLLVDVGTGYYVEKTPANASEYLKRKVEFVTANMNKIQALGADKSKVRDAVVEVMNIKIGAQMSAQSQVAGTAK